MLTCFALDHRLDATLGHLVLHLTIHFMLPLGISLWFFNILDISLSVYTRLCRYPICPCYPCDWRRACGLQHLFELWRSPELMTTVAWSRQVWEFESYKKWIHGFEARPGSATFVLQLRFCEPSCLTNRMSISKIFKNHYFILFYITQISECSCLTSAFVADNTVVAHHLCWNERRRPPGRPKKPSSWAGNTVWRTSSPIPGRQRPMWTRQMHWLLFSKYVTCHTSEY